MKAQIYAAPAVEGLMLVQRLRRWPNNKSILCQCLMFAGLGILLFSLHGNIKYMIFDLMAARPDMGGAMSL